MKGRGQWANRVLDDSDIERTLEYEEFMKKLQEYHDERGYVPRPTHVCHFPRIGSYSGFVQLIQSKHFVLRVGVGSVRGCALVRLTKRVTTYSLTQV